MNDIIDMRSDTVTKPTEEMREAMKNALVGDDVFGEDSTVKLLEAKTAQYLGKEAGLFVPSGTMANLLSLLTHCSGRGEEFIVGNKAHIFLYEQGGSSWLGGLSPHTLPNQPDGTIRLEDIENAIRPNDFHCPRTKLVCLENTHNHSGGRVLPVEYMDAVSSLCQKHGLKLHIDGARLINASTALKVPASRLVAGADSVSLCLSKGLAAPIGSVIVGTEDFIQKARRLRKALGGGMRQVGVIAAPALISVEKMTLRLDEDHRRAREIAESLAEYEHVQVYPVESNMVFVKFNEPLSISKIIEELKQKKILIQQLRGYTNSARIVLHNDITDDHVACFLRSIKLILTQ